MQTDQYGNQGHWLKKGTTTPCDAVPTIRNEQCYFSKDVLAIARGGFGVNVIQREDDNDDKLIVIPKEKEFSDKEILKLVNFQEKYFKPKTIRE